VPKPRCRSGQLSVASRTMAAIVLLATFLMPGRALAQTLEVSLSPTNLEIAVDGEGTITVSVPNVDGIFSAQFTLRYDPAVIEITDIEMGPLMADSTPMLQIDDDLGSLVFAAAMNDPDVLADGPGNLLIITVLGLEAGGSALSLEALLTDPDGSTLTDRARGGTVTVGQPSGPTSTAQPTSTSEPVYTAEPTSTESAGETPLPTETPLSTAASDTPRPAPGTAPRFPTMTPRPRATRVPQPTRTGAGGAPSDTPSAVTEPKGTAERPATAVAEVSTRAPSPTPEPARAAGGQPPADPPAGAGSGLPTWLFASILAVLLLLVGIMAIIVGIAAFSWFRRASRP
jgi:hypothetical protein